MVRYGSPKYISSPSQRAQRQKQITLNKKQIRKLQDRNSEINSGLNRRRMNVPFVREANKFYRQERRNNLDSIWNLKSINKSLTEKQRKEATQIKQLKRSGIKRRGKKSKGNGISKSGSFFKSIGRK